jgi:hypothetical protein
VREWEGETRAPARYRHSAAKTSADLILVNSCADEIVETSFGAGHL